MNIQIDRQNDVPRITENGKLVYSEKSDTLFIRTLKEGTKAINGDKTIVETDSTNMNAGAVRATAVTVANLNFVTAMNLEANVSSEVLLSVDREHMEFSMVRGDYLIITNDATTGTATCVVDWGEEI